MCILSGGFTSRPDLLSTCSGLGEAEGTWAVASGGPITDVCAVQVGDCLTAGSDGASVGWLLSSS